MSWSSGIGVVGGGGGGTALIPPLSDPVVTPFAGPYSIPSPLLASGGDMQFAVTANQGLFVHQVELVSPFYQNLGTPPTLDAIVDLGVQPVGTPIRFRLTSYNPVPNVVNIQYNDDTESNFNGLHCGPGCMNWTLDPATNHGADIVIGFEDLRGASGFSCASSDDGFEDIRIVLSGIVRSLGGWSSGLHAH